MQSISVGVYGIGDGGCGCRFGVIGPYQSADAFRNLSCGVSMLANGSVEYAIRAGRKSHRYRRNYSYRDNAVFVLKRGSVWWFEGLRHISCDYYKISIHLPIATPFLIVFLGVLTTHSKFIVASKRQSLNEALPMVQLRSNCVLLVSAVLLPEVKDRCLLYRNSALLQILHDAASLRILMHLLI